MKNFGILIVVLLVIGCLPKEEIADSQAESVEPVNEETKITLTDSQYKSAAIEMGKAEQRALSGTVKASGMLDVPPQNLVTISAPMGGFVKSTELLQGMKVVKGQIVAVMEHPDYIQLQQDYLDGKSQLEFLELEFKRQEELAKENVNAAKTLQQARSNYQSMKAKVEGLRARLAMINISADELEKGSIRSTIRLTSPISGFVTQVHVNLGMFVNPNDVMFRIVDTEHLHAEVVVFERDVSKLKIGQLVRITLSNEDSERLARVYLVGKEISEDRTVRVHCHLEKEDPSLLPGMFFNAVIESGHESVTTLPDAALVNFESKTFVFVARSERQFEMMEVTTGLHENGFTEVSLPAELDNANFVIRGAYDLLSMLKNKEEEE